MNTAADERRSTRIENGMPYPRSSAAIQFWIYWNDSKEPHRRPGLGGLSKPPVPVRSAHYGAKDLASVRLAWIQTFSSIPGEARVLLSSPTNAKRDRNRIPVRERQTLLSAQGAASTGYTTEKFAPHSSVREFLEEQPKKTPLLQLANESKERFQNL